MAIIHNKTDYLENWIEEHGKHIPTNEREEIVKRIKRLNDLFERAHANVTPETLLRNIGWGNVDIWGAK